jgi:hypothetical protein
MSQVWRISEMALQRRSPDMRRLFEQPKIRWLPRVGTHITTLVPWKETPEHS